MMQQLSTHCTEPWRAAIGIVRLVRLSNSIPASILVLIGAYLADGWPLAPAACYAAAAMWCVTAFGYASNDYFDIHEDSINKPDRPLPNGAVPTSSAAGLAIGLGLGAILFSLPLGPLPTVAALVVMALLTLYNLRLKATPGGGNLLIALLAGATLLVGSVAVRGVHSDALAVVFLPGCVLATFVAAREILKTLEDVEGDQRAGKATVATQLGAPGVVRIVGLLSALTMALSLLPVVWLDYSNAYLFTISLGVSLPLVFTTFSLWHDASPQRVSYCLALLKGSYFAGILALLLS